MKIDFTKTNITKSNEIHSILMLFSRWWNALPRFSMIWKMMVALFCTYSSSWVMLHHWWWQDTIFAVMITGSSFGVNWNDSAIEMIMSQWYIYELSCSFYLLQFSAENISLISITGCMISKIHSMQLRKISILKRYIELNDFINWKFLLK